jgi:FHS family glucose/mannose:H+ symporter-like MFS transporter
MKTIWPLIIISYAALFVFGITDNIRGPLFPEILKSFNVSDSMGSLMFALGSLSGFFASRFARELLYKFNRKHILQYACLGLSLSIVGLSFATHFYFFLLMSILFGIASGIIGLIPNILVPLGASVEKKQQLLSGLHSMYGIASLLAPLFVAVVNSFSGDWRTTYLLSAIFPFLLFLYCFHSSHEPYHQKPVSKNEAKKNATTNHFLPQLGMALILSFTVAAEVLISSRLALYTRRELNFTLDQSSYYVTFFFVALLLGRLLFTVKKFHVPLFWQIFTCQFFTVVCVALGLNFRVEFLALSGFFVAPVYPLMIALISAEFPTDLDSAISTMMATDSTMLAIMHLTVGKLTDLFGIHLAFNSALIFLCLSMTALSIYHIRKITKV